MNLKINVFGEKVQVFCGDEPLDLGDDAFLLGLMTDWQAYNGKVPPPLTTSELARLTASEIVDTDSNAREADRVKHAKARVRKKLLRALCLDPEASLEDIAQQALTDTAQFREGIYRGRKASSPVELEALEKTLLLYDRIFGGYGGVDNVLTEKIENMQKEYDRLFCSGIEVLIQQASPRLHTVVSAKIYQIKYSTTINVIKPGLLHGYKNAVAQRAAKIPLAGPDLCVEKVYADAEGRPTNLGDRQGNFKDDFIGREAEVEQIKAYLAEEWLVTLTGAGGCGKTTLMWEIGRHIVKRGMEEFPDGVWFVKLVLAAPNADKEAVAQHILKTLGLRLISEASAHDALVDYLRNKRMLLLLDNCEHLEKSVPRLLAALCDHCPTVKALVTTRVAGGSKWGQQIKVLPFVPLDPERLPELSVALQNEAIRLFQRCRQKAQAGFQVAEADLAPVAQICRLLSGIPLAIELVACKSGNLEHLAASLKTHWEEIPDGPEDAEERHETMSHCILWSYNRLSREEQTLFCRLALFAGGWTLAMCREVCALRDPESPRVFKDLTRLCESSMIVLDEQSDRYHFLEPVRGFAEEQLESSGEKEEILERMEAWLKSMIELEDFRVIGSTDENKVGRALEEAVNAENFVAQRAKNGEISAFDVELHSLIYRYAEGAFRVVRKRLHIFDKIVGKYPCEKQLRYHLAMGAISFAESNYKEVLEHGEKGLNAAISLGDRKHVALAHSAMGLCKAFLDLPEAEIQVRRGWEVAQETQDDWAIAFSQMCLGAWQWQRGDLEQALAAYEAAFAGFQQQRRDRIMSAMSLNSLAHLVCRSGAPCRAAGYYLDSLALSVEGKFKNARGMAGCVLGACGVAVILERGEQAAQFWGAAETHYEKLGAKLIPPVQSDYDREILAVRQQLGDRFTPLYHEGKRLSLTEATKQTRTFLESVVTQTGQASRLSAPTS